MRRSTFRTGRRDGGLMRTWIPALSLAAVICVSASAALADRRVVRDGDDARGRLDVKVAVAGHKSTGKSGHDLVRHRLTTFAPWGRKVLGDASTDVQFLFDTDDDHAADVQVTVDLRRGRLVALETDLDSGTSVGRARVWRPNRRSVAIALPKRNLGGGDYRWYAATAFHRDGSKACGTSGDAVAICGDRVPNKGFVHHEIP